MQLSGTSMAAPMVSGARRAAAQGTPSLTPAQVKMALQTGATYMPDGGLMGGGAGSVNFWASRKIARERSGRCCRHGLLGGLLGGPSGASFWDAGTLTHAALYQGHRHPPAARCSICRSPG